MQLRPLKQEMDLTTKLGVTMGQFKTIRGFRSTLLLLACASLALTPPASAQSVPPAQAGTQLAEATTPAQPAEPALMLGGGDLLKVSVFGAPEADQQVRVGQDGNVLLNFIGPVHVAGLTPTQAQDLIAQKLAAGGFYSQPQVSIFVMEYATQGVSVLGEVLKPGVYPVLGSRRLFDVLSLAGGTGPKAGRVVSISHRDHPESPRSVRLSNDPVESAKSNIEVLPGDTVVVSRAPVVYVVGDVKKPSGVIMDSGTDMTVLQAIAMAEGTNPTAALSKARLIRTTPAGRQELPLDLKNILASKAPDMRLQAEDIVFVPNSTSRTAFRKSLDAIVNIASGVAVYSVRP
jgi:polysaccharide export outer membrane protein